MTTEIIKRTSRFLFGLGKLVIICLAAACLLAVPAQGGDQPLLVVLEETGQMRNGMPVFRLHPDQERIRAVLLRGFSGKLLRLFQSEQTFLHQKDGIEAESAYLLLSSNQGGFPRFGFFLGDQEKRHAGYVDLPRGQRLTGSFGAVDQIFPHELIHIILQQLAGPPSSTEGNQVHAIGVRTDPVTAFEEGFAEHVQLLSVDDSDADPATRSMAANALLRERTYAQFRAYRRELTARWSPAGRFRMTFPLWFSGAEQALRYFAVKENAFAYVPDLPDRMTYNSDLYPAYLLENIVPGTPGQQPKTAARMLSTEGVVSALFYRWANSSPLRQHYREKIFYAQFGATLADVTPLENVFLKLFHVIYTHKVFDAAQLVSAYKTTFPDEAVDVDSVVNDVLVGQPLPTAPAIWLANADFLTGTSVFDQFRCAPRIHTFDLNAASIVDLLGVPGMDRSMAKAILNATPHGNLNELARVRGLSPQLIRRFESMAAERNRLRLDKEKMEDEMSLRTILLSYLWRALGWIFLGGIAGSALYRLARKIRFVRLIVNGLAAAFIGFMAGWIIGGEGLFSILAVLLLFGLPASLWQLWRHRAWIPALNVFLAWTVAALPTAILMRPWFS